MTMNSKVIQTKIWLNCCGMCSSIGVLVRWNHQPAISGEGLQPPLLSQIPGGPISPTCPTVPGIPGGPCFPSSPLGPWSPTFVSPGGPDKQMNGCTHRHTHIFTHTHAVIKQMLHHTHIYLSKNITMKSGNETSLWKGTLKSIHIILNAKKIS